MTNRESQILSWIRENPLISQQELAERAGITRSSVGVHVSNLMKKGLITGRGYVLGKEEYITVIGGVNIDIGGIPSSALIAEDSNPGKVRTSFGGVGRNIAHNVRLLGIDVSMMTVFGDDLNAKRIIENCRELGIDVSHSPLLEGMRTSTYLFIDDEHGDMKLAVSDMEIYDRLTPDLMSSRERLLHGASAIVIDTNIPKETIEYIANHANAPIFADTVSTAKAEKLRSIIGKLHTLKPNRIEAELLSGVKIRDEKSLKRAAKKLLDTGLKRVFITLGADGVLAAEEGSFVKLGLDECNLKNATGCGDAFTAALVWAYLKGFDLEKSAKAGLAAASVAMESEATINEMMSEELLASRM